ncbi:hypothetical protein ABID92_001340 [Frigoribacterium sp. PvP120]|jgi:hypothetical protein|nr:hypothetical protein [Frigoribacterium sp. PvP121]NII49723.1 hypothetical protein [Frigoribacterium endophyticum]
MLERRTFLSRALAEPLGEHRAYYDPSADDVDAD